MEVALPTSLVILDHLVVLIITYKILCQMKLRGEKSYLPLLEAINGRIKKGFLHGSGEDKSLLQIV